MKINLFWRRCGLFAALWIVSFTSAADHLIDQRHQYDIRVDGMTCPFCVATSRRALEKIAGVQDVAVDLERGEISVCADNQVAFTEHQLKRLFASKGFTFRSFTTTPQCSIVDQPHLPSSAEHSQPHDHSHGGYETGHGKEHH